MLTTATHFDDDTGDVTAIEVTDAPQEIHISHAFFSAYDDRFVDHDTERDEWTFGTINPATYREVKTKKRPYRTFTLVRWQQ